MGWGIKRERERRREKVLQPRNLPKYLAPFKLNHSHEISNLLYAIPEIVRKWTKKINLIKIIATSHTCGEERDENEINKINK